MNNMLKAAMAALIPALCSGAAYANSAATFQLGVDNNADTTQAGSSNDATVNQYGDRNNTRVQQSGTGNTATAL